MVGPRVIGWGPYLRGARRGVRLIVLGLVALSVAERQSCVAVRLVECAELPLLLLCLVQ